MKTICIFGDSVTWGRGLASRVAWANLLRNHLENQCSAIHLYDLGVDGNTTEDLLRRFKIEAESRAPDLIVWAIGVNDSAYRKNISNPVVQKDDFRANLISLASQGAKLCQRQVFVGIAKGSDDHTVPLEDSTTGKCYLKERVRDYDLIIKNVCELKGFMYIGIADILSDHDFCDGLHPNEEGHRKIFQQVQPLITELL